MINFRTPLLSCESAGPDWIHCRLTPKEYYCLVLGNVVLDRDDRRHLWELIGTQINMGHPRNMYYLRLALRHGNTQAVTQLLDLGWQANGPWWATFISPLCLSTRLEIETAEQAEHSSMEIYSFGDWKKPRWGDLDTHKSVFKMYYNAQRMLNENFFEVSKKNSAILRERGGKVPSVVTALRKDNVRHWSYFAYGFVYFVVLPWTLAYGTGHRWAWQGTMREKIGWMYVWSFLAVGNLPVFVAYEYLNFFTSQQLFVLSLWCIQALSQHLLPLLIVTSKGDHAWDALWIILVLELVVVMIGGITFTLICVGGLLIDVTYSIGCFLTGKGFRQGPVGIL